MQITNYQAGPRGINLADGSTHWVDRGQTVEITEKEGKSLIGDIEIKGALPDFGKPGDQADRDADEVVRLRQRVAELEAIVAKFDPDGDGKPGGSVGGEAASDETVKTALGLLDPTKDDDWTGAGLPKVDAVAALAGGSVTRAQIEALAPDLTRETASKG